MIEALGIFGSSSGLGTLGINGPAFLIQLITFLIVFLILRQWAFKPILRILQQRRDTIEQGVNIGEQMKKEQVELEQKVTEALHEARKKADDIVANAEAQARQAVQDAEDKALQKADGIITAAKDRIAQDTSRARKQLESEVANLVADATEVIIKEKVDAKKDAQLIDKAIKEQRVS